METVILYLPGFTFFLLLSTGVAVLFQRMARVHGWPYAMSVPGSVTLLNIWSALSGIGGDISFFVFVCMIAAAASWAVAAIPSFIARFVYDKISHVD